MRLYWSARSPFARKVMIVAHEAGVAERIEPVATLVTGETFNAGYAAINPTGLLPALVLDDGSTLFDSDVICEYLDTVFGDNRLLPLAAPRRFEVLRRVSLGNGLMDRAVRWLGENFRPEPLRFSDVTNACRSWIRTTLDALEEEAQTAPAGRFDLGDAAAASGLAYLDFRFAAEAWREGRPALAERFARFAERPSLAATAYQAQR